MFRNEERGIFTQRLNLQRGTLTNYEIGTHEPISSAINAYHRVHNINSHWLVTNEGEMFSDMATAKETGFKEPTIPAGLMKIRDRIAYTTYRNAI